jgi:hypothetical protein
MSEIDNFASTSASTLDDDDLTYAEELTSLLGRLRGEEGAGQRGRDEILEELGWKSPAGKGDEDVAGTKSTFTPEEVKEMVAKRFLTPRWSFDEEYLGAFQM